MRWVPKLAYGDPETVVSLTYDQKPWRVETVGRGGHGLSAAGVPESYQIRRDERVRVRFRFTETEWVSKVRPFVVWAQGSGATFKFYPDKDAAAGSAGEFYTCYLDAPTMGETVDPVRDPYFGLLELELVFRISAAGTTFSTVYH